MQLIGFRPLQASLSVTCCDESEASHRLLGGISSINSYRFSHFCICISSSGIKSVCFLFYSPLHGEFLRHSEHECHNNGDKLRQFGVSFSSHVESRSQQSNVQH